MREKFKLSDWVDMPKKEVIDNSKQAAPNSMEKINSVTNTKQPIIFSEIERVIIKLEEAKLDITGTYSDWRNVGFAFADELGESGRDLFQRVSRFYPTYNEIECSDQFDKCLESKGHGVNINTFFFLAKQAGIDIGKVDNTIEVKPMNMPTIPDTVFPKIPEFLQNVTMYANSNEERDILLLGAVVCLSACIPNIYGIYGNSKVYPNLFLFVSGRASAGKGVLNHCKHLVNPVHQDLREQTARAKQDYEVELTTYNQSKGSSTNVQKPAKPPEKMLYIPANNSSTGAYQLLADSGGKGLIFETEGDTLAQSFKSDYGNYSDGFRKAFHHETISYFRRTDKELVEIERPCLSAMLSGTPKQITSLIPSSENGLFSRFIFYYMNTKYEWLDVFASSESVALEDYFKGLGNSFYKYYQYLKKAQPICFNLAPDQQQVFNQYFAQMQERYLALLGEDFLGSIRRLGLITFRLSMIFTVLRSFETGEVTNTLVCTEDDFQAGLSIISVLMKHSSHIFSELPKENHSQIYRTTKEQFFDALPPTFNRQAYLKLADTLGIKPKTAEGYISQFKKNGLVHHTKHDHYLKGQ